MAWRPSSTTNASRPAASSETTLRFLSRALSPYDPEHSARDQLRSAITQGAVVWQEVVATASRHLVTPALRQSFADKGLLDDLPADVRDYLDAVHELNGARNRRIAAQLHALRVPLNAAGIDPVLLKGSAYLCADLYRDPAARVIGDIDLLLPRDALPAAVAALKASGYRETAVDDPARFAAHHHHTPLAREGDVAGVELHVEPMAQPFQTLLPAARVLGSARRVGVDEGYLLPAPQDTVVHSIAHMQLTDGHYWCARPVLRPLCDLVWLRRSSAAAIDWQELLERFDRAGYGGACRAYLMLAERLFGQPLPVGVRPGLGARVAWWRVRHQTRHPWLMATGEAYGCHRAMLARLKAGPKSRERLMTRLLHPKGYQRYVRALRARIGRAH